MKKVITTNRVRFNGNYFPYRKQSVIDEDVMERLERLGNQLRVESPVTWKAYDKTLPRSGYDSYEEVTYDHVTDDLVMRVVDRPETFARVNQYQYLTDIHH